MTARTRSRGRGTRGRTRRSEGGMVVAAVVALALMWWGSTGPVLDVLDPTAAAPSAAAVADIPPAYLALYQRVGGTCAGLDWALLAGVGKVETNHGRARLPGVTSGTNFAAAAGPMQFLGPTWREVRGNHPDVGPDIYDPAHAIPAAAHYLCDGGLTEGRGVRAALWTYNHSRAYATNVLEHAERYRATGGGPT